MHMIIRAAVVGVYIYMYIYVCVVDLCAYCDKGSTVTIDVITALG